MKLPLKAKMLPFLDQKRTISWLIWLAVLTTWWRGGLLFRIATNSMLCLPPSPASEIQPPPWSQLILWANLPNHEWEPRGKTGIVRLLHHKLCLLPFEPFNGRRSLSALNRHQSQRSLVGGGKDHVYHYDGPHHHRSHPAAEILQQNQAVSTDHELLWFLAGGQWKICWTLFSIMKRK